MKSIHEPQLRAHRLADLFAPATVVLFAGCGGTCIGIEQAYVDGGYSDKYIDLAINHWDTAVGVHALNHPMTQHIRGDVREVDPNSVLQGRDIAYLWASPDCTHFSKARGSKPKKKEIRGLAWVVIAWAKKRRPTVIVLENVEEFTTWGPIARDGQPCPRRKGHTFKKWKSALEGLGYAVEHQELRAMHYGAPTTRKRLKVVARCDGKPIVWPEKTHGKVETHSDRHSTQAGEMHRRPNDDQPSGDTPRKNGGIQRSDGCNPSRGERVLLGGKSRGRLSSGSRELKPFRTAAECIYWSIPMLSIFATPAEAKAWAIAMNAGRPKHEQIGTPRRPLKDKTLKRIAGGLVKWVLQAKRPFIVRLAHGDQSDGAVRWGHPTHSVDQPIGTVTGSKDYAAVDVTVAPYTVPNLGERDGQAPRSASVEQPAPTITSKGNGARLVTAHLATLNHGGDEHRSASVTEPIATITGANDARALVSALITKHYGGVVGHGVEQPLDTITAKDHNALTVAHLIKFRGKSPGTAADAPMDTITGGSSARPAGAGHAMGLSAVYLSQMYGTNAGTNGDPAAPAASITGSGNHAAIVAAFLDTYYGNSKDGGSPTDPMPTVVSKDRISLVTVIIDDVTYVVTDIAMRMLTPRELLLAQGFPADYRVDVTADGERVTKADQVKLIGNSVCPPVARALTYANVVAQGVLDGTAVAS